MRESEEKYKIDDMKGRKCTYRDASLDEGRAGKGKEIKGKERKGKERKGKDREGKAAEN